jgi:MFS family permease
LSDYVGRRIPIIAAYAGMLVVATMAVMISEEDYSTIAVGVVNFLLGSSLGIGLPAANTLVSELSPSPYRCAMICSLSAMFACGELSNIIFIIRSIIFCYVAMVCCS